MDPEQAHACEEGISVSLPWLAEIQTKEQAIIPELGGGGEGYGREANEEGSVHVEHAHSASPGERRM